MSTDPRTAFSEMTKALVVDFRAHGGVVTQGPFKGRPVLLLTTTGAKSGQKRLAPLVYSRDGDRYVVAASKGGSPTHPSWYANLVADPNVTVEVGEETFEARAIVTEGEERERLWSRWAEIDKNLDDYAARRPTETAVVVLEPGDAAEPGA